MMNVALSTLYTAEPLLMVVAMVTLLRSREHRRFPALFAYVTVRLTSTVMLHLLMHAHRFITVSEKAVYSCYFYTYWCSYVASAIVVFLVIQELFQSSMDPFPGLKWLGTISFRWVACISFVATSAALLAPGGKGNKFVLALVGQAMRCESVFILSLLLFLMVAAGKLGLSYRSRVFGISSGFGIMAASDLIVSAAFLHFGDNMLTSTVSVVTTSASLVTLAVWSAYFLVPEPTRQVTAFSASSPLARWNEIATTLEHSTPRVPVAVPASDFFLQDVEKVVDRILVKNSLHVAS
ncbi:MAG: hypothetical protein QOI94_1064 [Acidobacteriaceae bacterium]|nr:hypothetical protein [Acidobacteriaceae bacterium]